MTGLEAIDNANPSKAMECLEELHHQLYGDTLDIDRSRFALPIKNALLKAQEQKKVLEIIKEKYVEIYILLKSKNVEQYNFNIRFGKQLTEEEFDLLKRYFK